MKSIKNISLFFAGVATGLLSVGLVIKNFIKGLPPDNSGPNNIKEMR